MLFDPKWQKPDPFKLETLITWLERQDPEENYTYDSCAYCLLARYFTDQGYNEVAVGKNYFTAMPKNAGGEQHILPAHFNWIAEAAPHTFAEALGRADFAHNDPYQANLCEAMHLLTRHG